MHTVPDPAAEPDGGGAGRNRTAVAPGVHRTSARQRIPCRAAPLWTDLDDPDVRMELWSVPRQR